jgi:hypothetical protein
MAIDQPRKTRENRLRHAARRQGLELRKNPRRDPRALDFGSYTLVDPATTGVVADFGWITPGRGDHLDAVELYLYPDQAHHTPSASEES